MRGLRADAGVVVAYGRLLPKELLAVPRLGCVNIHASLLPSYRGAAPIQWAVIDGRKESGVTTMLMDEGLDTGDILKQYRVTLAEDETGGSLFEKLSALGAAAIVDTLREMEEGSLVPTPQGETDTRYASVFSKNDGKIDWNRPAEEIERLVRGLDPWPGTFTWHDGKKLKITGAEVWEGELPDDGFLPGTVVLPGGRQLLVKTGRGFLRVTELQPEGKKRMKTDAFLNGNRTETGDRLGEER